MLKIEYSHTKEKYRLKFDGHCNTAPKGYDVVCASVSILCITMSRVLEQNKDKLKEEPKIVLNDGDAELVWKPQKKYEAALVNSLYTVMVGLEFLAANYPEVVELVKK